jgi:hypothetical protein
MAHLSLDDGQGGQAATLLLFGHLGGALEQTRVKVEDIAGVSLTT